MSKEYAISLNSYERDNLLFLLQELLGWGNQGVDPFTYANSGEWVASICIKLQDAGVGRGSVYDHGPIYSRNQIKRSVQLWLERNIHENIDYYQKAI